MTTYAWIVNKNVILLVIKLSIQTNVYMEYITYTFIAYFNKNITI